MLKSSEIIKIVLSLYRLLPSYWIFCLSYSKMTIIEDADFWNKLFSRESHRAFIKIGLLLWDFKEFRNVAANRILYSDNKISPVIKKILFRIFKILYPGRNSLFIDTKNIGNRLFIQHGFSTIISADVIGKECWINQQVTIGREQGAGAIIGDHVRICAGAIIIGNVKVGDNSIIAAGAVVVNDVPPNEIWGGVPARFIKPVKGDSFGAQK